MRRALLRAGGAGRVGNRLRRHLTVTTILTTLPLLGWSNAVHAACVASPSPTFVCSGANTVTQNVTADNANVSTVPGFSVVTTTDNGLSIRGDGNIRFTDENASIITGDIYGLIITSSGDDGTTQGAITIVTDGDISGHSGAGISAYNRGSGDLAITANGSVTGVGIPTANGIQAINNGANLSITTGVGSVTTGTDSGIFAVNNGSGNLTITANGSVTGRGGDDIFGGAGIYAVNSVDSADLTITTGAGSAVVGGYDGIKADNNGSGALTITVDGAVSGEGGEGIYATNDGTDLTITVGAQSAISGSARGILASNHGSGALTITVNGAVTGEGNGIDAYNDNDATDMTITTGVGSVIASTEDRIGIDALHEGSGALAITVNGSVTGFNGINARNNGGDATSITIGATGLVQGEGVAIAANTITGQDISIKNAGVVRNLSGESDDRAISTTGATNIVNSGVLIGTVNLAGDFLKEVDNSGVWNSAGGVSDFGIGLSGVGNTGTFIAADDGAASEETRLVNLEFFFNSGLVTMADGGAGDSLEISGNYDVVSGSQGRLAVDAVLGPSGQSDRLIVGNNTNGSTLITVNVVDVQGASLDGISVVEVTGATGEEDFDLAGGVLNAGFWTWGLRLDGHVHELFALGVGPGASEFAAGMTGAQDIWHQTMGSLQERQADLRPLLDSMSVTPVADYAEPVTPTPLARATPGFWFKGVGAYIERDDEADGFSLNRRQTVWGGLAGFDTGTQNAESAWLYGAFAGYLTSDLGFDETHSEWTYEGPTIGAYITYLDHAFHVDVTMKADFLSIEIDPEDLASGADDADTDAVNLGGRIDTGYRFGESVFVEPQATLAVVHTDIDDVDIFGATAEFDSETSIRGRLGLRLGFDHMSSNHVVYSGDVTASVWEDFSGDNDVTIADPVLPASASNDPGQTTGDVSLGLNAVSPDGWSGFIRGSYLFAEDYEAFTGNAGIRLAW